MTTKYEHYSVFIQWSIPDNAYLVTVPELPGLMTHGATYEEAVRNAQEVIEVWIDGSEEWGLSMPEPSVVKEYVGQEPIPGNGMGLRNGYGAPRHAVRYPLYSREQLERTLLGRRLTQLRKGNGTIA